MRPPILLALLSVAGCTRPAEPPGAALTRELAGRVAGASESCVSALPSQNLRAIDSSSLVYGYGPTIYVNRLPGSCPGLGPLNTLIVDARGNQYCRGDRVRGLEAGAVIPGPSCNLGDWVPYRRP